MTQYDREGLNNLLLGLGFYKKLDKDAEVPDEYLTGPYVPLESSEIVTDEETSHATDEL